MLHGAPEGEHLFRARDDRRRHLASANHPRKLPFPLDAIHAQDVGHGPASPDAFFNPVVRGAVSGNLRKVSDAQDLERRAQRLEPRADNVRDGASDARIDLVEDEGLPGLIR